jgi:hypothetical protein
MKSIETRASSARARSAMNTNAPFSTHTKWISSSGTAARISAARVSILVASCSAEISGAGDGMASGA